jgi:glucose/arabinose dehydrogenase
VTDRKRSEQEEPSRQPGARERVERRARWQPLRLPALVLVVALVIAACAQGDDAGVGGQDDEVEQTEDTQAKENAGGAKGRQLDPAAVQLPPGYFIEAVAKGLNYATSVAFGDDGSVYVAEAGGHTYGTKPEEAPPARILRVERDGTTRVVYDKGPSLAEIREADTAGEIPEGLIGPITGLTWHDGKLYVAHRTRVSTLEPRTGAFDTIVDGLPGWGEFQNNKVIFGPDAKMYFFVSTQGNSGPVGDHMLKVLKAYNKPNQHEIPCQDVTLTGENFESENPFTPAPDDKATYDAFVPFGEDVPPGTVIKGQIPCNGAFFRANRDATNLELFAWGLRSDFGYRFAPDGRLISTQNSGNPIPPREIYDDWETIWEVRRGVWYGWPDYWSGIPVTDKRFQAPSGEKLEKAPQPLSFLFTEDTHRRLLRGGQVPQPLVKLTPHVAAEGFVFGRNDFGVPDDDILLAEFGTVVTYQAKELPGFRVEQVDLDTGHTKAFAVNKSGKPASATPKEPGGLERPIQLEFAPDGSLYLVDFGIIDVDENGLKAVPGSGVLWRIWRG